PALGFAELRSVSASDQRGYCGIDPLPLDTPDEFGAGGDIAPLIGGTQLEAAPVSTEQLQVVHGLQQHITEFGVRSEERRVGKECRARTGPDERNKRRGVTAARP